ncbi:MAG: MerR family transcriptional regulator [Gammaproteobacteria bacterium]|nr:MerR family transcriptional regulator [Gammaproteobacteria bacterium]
MTGASAQGPARHTISQIARIAGVSVSRVRTWCVMGLVRPRAVTAAGYHLFDDADVERLRFIAVAMGAGLPLPDVARVLTAFDRGDAERMEQARGALRRRIKERRRALNEFAALLKRLGAADTVAPVKGASS